MQRGRVPGCRQGRPGCAAQWAASGFKNPARRFAPDGPVGSRRNRARLQQGERRRRCFACRSPV